jgi:amino acid transporter
MVLSTVSNYVEEANDCSRFGWIILIAAELIAITHIFQFNYPPNLLSAAGYPSESLSFSPDIAPGVIILMFIPVILLLNLLPVKQFGQMEYICGSIKLTFVVLMIVLNTVLHSLQRVQGEKPFWTYNPPYGAAAQNITLADGVTVVSGGVGTLAGMW